MVNQSAGILVYKMDGTNVRIFLVHPGGPFWVRKDSGAWSIPKGEFDPDTEEPLTAALRELKEETGLEIKGTPAFLGTVKQAGGKIVHAWCIEADFDPKIVKSNMFEMEWPKGSGKLKTFPEIDRAGWFDPDTAKQKINKGQAPLIDMLLKKRDNSG